MDRICRKSAIHQDINQSPGIKWFASLEKIEPLFCEAMCTWIMIFSFLTRETNKQKQIFFAQQHFSLLPSPDVQNILFWSRRHSKLFSGEYSSLQGNIKKRRPKKRTPYITSNTVQDFFTRVQLLWKYPPPPFESKNSQNLK